MPLVTVGSIVVTLRGIGARKQVEQRLSRSEARFRSLVQHSSDVVAVLGADGLISYISPSVAAVLGYDADDLLDTDFSSLVHADDRHEFRRLCSSLAGIGQPPSRTEARIGNAAGMWRTLDMTLSDLRDHSAVEGVVLNAHDVTERKELETNLEHQASYDDLTGLANRALFRRRLATALAGQRPGSGDLAVLFIDLDEFKTINDSLGHHVGDELLTEVATRLRSVNRKHDVVARLGGDEFALLVTTGGQGAAERVAERALLAMATPFFIDGRLLQVGASIGIAYSDRPEFGVTELLRNADTAMYEAKRLGKGRLKCFDASMHATVSERLELLNDLQTVLERDELQLYYQPIVEPRSGRIKAFEALVRWQHPTRGMISPMSFVPLAEESGLILPMTEWVLDTALAQLARWKNEGLGSDSLTMSVNMSARHLEADGAAQLVERCLARNRLAPGDLTVELTESVAIDVESPTIQRRLQAITSLGVALAADDFGTGFASYASLQHLPFTAIKIDRKLIDGLGGLNSEKAAIQVGSIVAMAHQAGMIVVAEGVEVSQQLEALLGLNCDACQGYYFARPMPAEMAGRLLRDGSSQTGHTVS